MTTKKKPAARPCAMYPACKKSNISGKEMCPKCREWAETEAADPDKKKHLKSGDYVLTEGSGWFEYKGLVAHVFVPYMTNEVRVEIFPVDSDMDDDDILAHCSAEQP